MALEKFTTQYFHSQFPHSSDDNPGARQPGNCGVKVLPQAVRHNCPPTIGHLRNECPGTKGRA